MKRILTLTLAACLVSVFTTSTAASAIEDYGEVRSTESVNVRVAPNLSGEAFIRLPPETPSNIRCAIAGQQIYDTNVWFYSDFDNGQRGFWTAYYSDADYNTWADLENRYGIARCERPSTTPGGSVYYQPRYHLGDPIAPTATYTAAKDYWSASNCSAYSATNYWPEHFDDQLVTRASAWSLGRLGITYMLSHDRERAENLNEIILFDPANLDEYANNHCDAVYNQDRLMADWLQGDSERRLLVLAGAWTRDANNPDELGQLHQGIQQHLFPAIRNLGLSDQVLVCNYDNMGHAAVMDNFGHLAQEGSVTSCPGSPDAAWNPGTPPADNPCFTAFHPEMTVTYSGYSQGEIDELGLPGERTVVNVDLMWPTDRLRFTECRSRPTVEISLLMGVANDRHGLTEINGQSWESDLPAHYDDVSTGNSNGHEISFGSADATALEPGRWYHASITLEGALGSDEILDATMNRGYRWALAAGICPPTGTIVSAWCVSGWTEDYRYGPEYTDLIRQERPQYFQPIHGRLIDVY